jgi:hypothetical protein
MTELRRAIAPVIAVTIFDEIVKKPSIKLAKI